MVVHTVAQSLHAGFINFAVQPVFYGQGVNLQGIGGRADTGIINGDFMGVNMKLQITQTQPAQRHEKMIFTGSRVVTENKIAVADMRAHPKIVKMLAIAAEDQRVFRNIQFQISKADLLLTQIEDQIDTVVTVCGEGFAAGGQKLRFLIPRRQCGVLHTLADSLIGAFLKSAEIGDGDRQALSNLQLPDGARIERSRLFRKAGRYKAFRTGFSGVIKEGIAELAGQDRYRTALVSGILGTEGIGAALRKDTGIRKHAKDQTGFFSPIGKMILARMPDADEQRIFTRSCEG